MKLRDGFVSNSSSTSFVLRVGGKKGKQELLKIFKDTWDKTGDATYIEMYGDQEVVDKIRIALYKDYVNYFPNEYKKNIFRYRCEDFAICEKKYGEDIAIVRVYNCDELTKNALKKSKYLSILSSEER